VQSDDVLTTPDQGEEVLYGHQPTQGLSQRLNQTQRQTLVLGLALAYAAPVDLIAALADVELRLEQKRRERVQLDLEVRQLEIEHRGLTLAVKRHDAAPVDLESLDEPDFFAGMSRTQAIVTVLREAGRPMSPSEIVTELNQRGRSDGPKVVSASLAHLQKQGKVRSESRGEWVPTFTTDRDAFLANAAGVSTPEELEAIRDTLTPEKVDALNRERLLASLKAHPEVVERWRQHSQNRQPDASSTPVIPVSDDEIQHAEPKDAPGRTPQVATSSEVVEKGGD
jgi:hypothetical protein